jgi:peptidyl-prolyl cis-trans isomerase B (cyclophilin B)
MKKRKSNRDDRPQGDPVSLPSTPPDQGRGAAHPPVALWWGLLGAVAVGLALWVWLGRGRKSDDEPPENVAAASTDPSSDPAPDLDPPKKQAGTDPKAKDPGGTFLDAFGAKSGPDGESEGPAAANDELEKKFQALLDIRARTQGRILARDERARLEARLNKDLASFEKALKHARQARPEDAVPAWLTGELLLLIGGHPTEEILPRLRFAVERGLLRPRLYASLARAQTEGNQPEAAFRSAAKALDLDGKDRYAWNAFTRAAFNVEKFAEVADRVERSFPDRRPAWAEEMYSAARDWQKRWQAEQKRRLAEQKADDLPRVRLVIEHRRFARDASGNALTTIESTGKGEVILELFEDQAPAAVASFLTLVEQKVYDGTRFYLAQPAGLVAGGDPKSRTGDPSDDGTGNPGYFIPDEFTRPDARGHFRGSLSLVNNGPKTTGCQFFITLVPIQEMDGQFTVFGRVLKGQEVIDRITPGRTNRQVGRFGRIIPGDLLVRAEVMRKLAHEYRVTKLPQD